MYDTTLSTEKKKVSIFKVPDTVWHKYPISLSEQANEEAEGYRMQSDVESLCS